MFRSYANLLLLSTMVLFTCLLQQKAFAQSATDEIQKSVAEIAEKIVSEIDSQGSFAISYNENTAGSIPESLIEQVGNIVESELLIASEFELNLTNQSSQEQAWENSIEFNNADFDEIFKNSKLDGLIIVNTRAVEKGLEISMRIISVAAATSGQTIASSGSKFVSLDWAQFSTIDLTEKTAEKIARIQEAIENLRQLNEPIEQPKSFPEYIHNAKLYQKDGDLLNSIKNFELAVISEPKFVDVISDLTQLLIQKFGSKNAQIYLEKKIRPHVDDEFFQFASLIVEPDTETTGVYAFIDDDVQFSPLAAKWLWGVGQQVYDQRANTGNKYISDYALLSAARNIIRSFDKGEFQNYFLDSLRASELARVDEAKALEQKLNRLEYSLFETMHQRNSGLSYFDVPAICLKSMLFYPNKAPTKLLEQKIAECGKFVEKSGSVASLTKYFEYDAELNLSNPDAQIFPTKPSQVDLNKIFGNGFFTTAPCFNPRPGVLAKYEIETPLIEMPLNFQSNYLTQDMDVSDYLRLSNKLDAEFKDVFVQLHPTVASDRLIFGDYCLQNEENEARVNGISELIITDDVDTNLPILISAIIPSFSDEIHQIVVDISIDGTITSDSGLQVTTEKGEGYFTILSGKKNNWYFAPGIVQSLIGRTTLVSVNYTDVYGKSKEINVNNIFVHSSESYWKSLRNQGEFTGDNNQLRPNFITNGYTVDGSRDWSDERVKTKGFILTKEPLTCPVNDLDARIINVQNFTNLRKQAGLNGRVIGKVSLGETVQIVNPGRYLRYDRCAAACEGSNQNAIKTCVENNDVWIEVQHNGRRGFLSRKFLE